MQARPAQWSRGTHGGDFAGEESSAKYVQQAVNALRKAEMRVARIGKERRRRRLGLWRMRRRFKLHTQKRNADSTLLEKLVAELGNAQQQEEAAKKAMARSIEIFAGLAMDVSKEEAAPPAQSSWERMLCIRVRPQRSNQSSWR